MQCKKSGAAETRSSDPAFFFRLCARDGLHAYAGVVCACAWTTCSSVGLLHVVNAIEVTMGFSKPGLCNLIGPSSL